jgi:hypothetical protein
LIAVDLIAIGVDIWELSLLEGVLSGEEVSTDALVASDDRQTIMAVVEFSLLVFTAFVFVKWFHASYRNLPSLGVTQPRFKTGWAIGAWFVPVLNLWRPKQIANDIWRASDPDAPRSQGADWRQRPYPELLSLWWALWIIGSFVGNAAARTWFSGGTVTDLRNAARLDIAVLLLDITAAALAMLVVRRMTRRQVERASRLAAVAAEST